MAILATPAIAGVLDARDALLRAAPLGNQPYGTSVAGVGDVNGDGLDDVASVQEAPGPDGRRGPSLLVVFGSRDRVALDPLATAGGGFVVDGAPDGFPDDDVGGLTDAETVGMSVAAAGDVNGDGLDDVVVGAASLGNSFRRRSGSAFVVFGKRDADPVRLDALGEGGFRVDGPRAGAGLGGTAAGLGDLDGDGRSEVALSSSTAAYVVFGKADSALVDLRAPGDTAYPISGPPAAEEGDGNVHTVAPAGDANGDGRGDVLVSTSGYLGRDEGLWVVFGKPGREPVDLRSLGAGGYSIAGTDADGPSPGTAAGAGDVDGDGRGDVVIGVGDTAWVVYGRREPGSVDVRRDRTGVLTVPGAGGELQYSFPVAGIGDVNGDGLSDIASGVPDTDGSCRTDAGLLRVAYGRAGGGQVRAAGFVLRGDETRANLGGAFAGAGDVNGDGRPDIVLDVAPYSAPGTGRELRVVTAADTGRPVPRRGRCVTVRVRERSLRQIRRTQRVHVTVAVEEPGDVLVMPELDVCDRRRCRGAAAPQPSARLIRFAEAGTRSVTLRFNRRTLRALRDPRVTHLYICANEDACVGFPTRARRRGRR